MLNFLTPHASRTQGALRIVAGLLFIFHGTQKLFAFPLALPEGVPEFVVYVAGPIELVGGALILIGLFTRISAFICSGLMAAAYFMAHAFQALYPILNQGELSILYCFIFLFIAANGPGAWSLDNDE